MKIKKNLLAMFFVGVDVLKILIIKLTSYNLVERKSIAAVLYNIVLVGGRFCGGLTLWQQTNDHWGFVV